MGPRILPGIGSHAVPLSEPHRQDTAITSVLGPQSNAASANALMWVFFRAHPLP